MKYSDLDSRPPDCTPLWSPWQWRNWREGRRGGGEGGKNEREREREEGGREEGRGEKRERQKINRVSGGKRVDLLHSSRMRGGERASGEVHMNWPRLTAIVKHHRIPPGME